MVGDVGNQECPPEVKDDFLACFPNQAFGVLVAQGSKEFGDHRRIKQSHQGNVEKER